MDVDLLCELSEDRITEFLSCFDEDCYVREAAVREAVDRRSCFNLIHLPTSFKIDVFVSEGRPYDITRIRHATHEHLGSGRTIVVPTTSPEDSVISKLKWYRDGNETSERQLDDVPKLAKLLGSSLDLSYRQEAAASVGVSDVRRSIVVARSVRIHGVRHSNGIRLPRFPRGG